MTRRQINKKLRAADDSNLWPILGRFNVTDRAILHVKKWEKLAGYNVDDYEEAVMLEISKIVNSY